MATNTTEVWGAFAASQLGSSDWTAIALTNNTTATGDMIDASGNANMIFGIKLTEDNTGAITGDVTVYVEADVNGTDVETGNEAFSFTVTPVQNISIYKAFSLSVANYDRFKIAIHNESGQTLDITVTQKFSHIETA